ncbi:pancreatic triacylglycerol lipase-like [Planococcus citri]|uniref:pancreatic triacylglycerol lipase-like n=1 Tax=Planococcus citri TaxID=170843 RepID=UPI0031F7B277
MLLSSLKVCRTVLWSCFYLIFLIYGAHSSNKTEDADLHPATLLGQRAAQLIKNRLLRRQERIQLRSREVCYDMVGCFPMPRSQISPLKKPPQPPEAVDTKFILLTRNFIETNITNLLKYGDNQKSLLDANLDISLPIKLIVHGFKGSGQDRGAIEIATSFLDVENANIVLVDWHKGAAGPSYISAAANTQLVGRQLALLIMELLSHGADASQMHIIGFSLGAHIAGYAGRAIQKVRVKIGRITGLDPASPLFRELLSSSLSPLNKNDAKFVDIIHTDGARFLTEGLGIFKPIGHVDYFPNGGFDQPGCNHVRGAVLVSHLGNSLNTSLVCNHLRAWQLFLESLKSEKTGCEFFSFPCPGGWNSFEKGNCFPTDCADQSCGKMGYHAAESRFLGPLFLATRDSSPFCGHQLKASVLLSKEMASLRAYMQLSLLTEQDNTHFQLYSDFRDELQGGYILHGIGTAPFGAIHPEKTPSLIVHISCYKLAQKQTTKRSAIQNYVAIDEVVIRDIYGHFWRYYNISTPLYNVNGTNVEAVTVELQLTN